MVPVAQQLDAGPKGRAAQHLDERRVRAVGAEPVRADHLGAPAREMRQGGGAGGRRTRPAPFSATTRPTNRISRSRRRGGGNAPRSRQFGSTTGGRAGVAMPSRRRPRRYSDTVTTRASRRSRAVRSRGRRARRMASGSLWRNRHDRRRRSRRASASAISGAVVDLDQRGAQWPQGAGDGGGVAQVDVARIQPPGRAPGTSRPRRSRLPARRRSPGCGRAVAWRPGAGRSSRPRRCGRGRSLPAAAGRRRPGDRRLRHRRGPTCTAHGVAMLRAHDTAPDAACCCRVASWRCSVALLLRVIAPGGWTAAKLAMLLGFAGAGAVARAVRRQRYGCRASGGSADRPAAPGAVPAHGHRGDGAQ